MQKKRRLMLFLTLLVLGLLCAGCRRQEEDDDGYRIYYLDKDITKIVEKPYSPQSKQDDTKGLIHEFLEQMQTDVKDVEYQKPIPNDVKITEIMLDETVLSLYFNTAYNSMDKIREALVRAAIVRTMSQIEGVSCVSFYVGDAPLLDKSGNLVGVMTNESFIENPGEQINTLQTTTLVLYFANKEGNGLVKETQVVHHSSNISMEKLIIEQLLQGPQEVEAQSAIPEGTKLVNVSILDGVCSVSLDESFLNQNYGIEEPIVIYSIVNSLSEIPNVTKVQISVNGDTGGKYRDSYALSELYERNLDYVEE